MAIGCHGQPVQPTTAHPADTSRAAKLAFTVQPSNTFAGAVITPAIQVTALDSQSNMVPDFTGNVTVALGANPGGGTLAGTKTVAASKGAATFEDLSIDLAGSPYTLLALATGLTTAGSTAFNVAVPCCWTVKASMPTARASFDVGALNGVLYAVGGLTSFIDSLSTVEAYDPNTNSWTTKARMPTARLGLAVGVVNGILYAVGGAVPRVGSVGTVEAYNPLTNTWAIKTPMPTARYGLGLGVVNGILYAVGGIGNGTQWAAVEAYDPVSDTWTAKAPMSTARFYLGVGVVNGLLYAIGGQNGTVPSASTLVEAYDPVANSWATKASLATGRSNFGVGVVGGTLSLVGGYAFGVTTSTIVNTVEAYDPTTNTWTTKSPMPTARVFLGVGVLNNILYALGGTATDGTYLGTNEAYQP